MELKVLKTICILAIIVDFIECYNWPRFRPGLNCSDLNPQRTVNIAEILGTWYGYEIFAHHIDVEDEVNLNPCVVVQLSDISYQAVTERTPQMDTRFEEYHNRQVFQYDLPQQQPYGSQYFHYLQLTWSEQDRNSHYTLRFNTSRPGLWHSASPQRGTMQKLNYGPFDGTIQALKVSENHMLLSFCFEQLFSIILTREPKILALEDLQSVRILLNHHGLSVASGRQDCSGTTSVHTMSIVSLFVTTIVAFLLKCP